MIHSTPTRFRDDPALDTAAKFAIRATQRTPDDVRFVIVQRGSPVDADVGMLIEKRYAARGLWLGATAANQSDHNVTTIAALRGSRVVATVSVRSDGPQGLLAEHLYPLEIQARRKLGERLCELTRLAADTSFGSQPALASLFNAAYRIAILTYDATDFVMEVHPRHAAYYSRMIGCQIVGRETICPRVNAPAVLLHMPSRRVEDRLSLATTRQSPTPKSPRRSIYDYLQRAATTSQIGHCWSPTLATTPA